jgi:hypothetical protein
MAINEDNKIQINVDAEKTAFSDKIATPTVYRDMAMPSENIKIEPFASDFSKPDSFNPFQFEKNVMGSQDQPPIALESQTLQFDQSTAFNMLNQSSLMTGLDSNNDTFKSLSNFLASQQLTSSTLNQQPPISHSDVNKQVQKAITKDIVPALENVAQYIQQSSNLNTDHKNVHDELPTISPNNLAFNDRSESAMDRPTWA